MFFHASWRRRFLFPAQFTTVASIKIQKQLFEWKAKLCIQIDRKQFLNLYVRTLYNVCEVPQTFA